MGLFKKATVNMSSCSEIKEEEDEGSDKQGNPPRVAGMVLTALKTLLIRVD